DARLLDDLLDPSLSREAKELLVARRSPPAGAWQLVVGRIFDADALDTTVFTLRLRQFSRRHMALLRVADSGDECIIAIPTADVASRSGEAVLRELHQVFERQRARAPGLRYGLGQSGPAALPDAVTLLQEARKTMAFGVRLNGFNRMSKHEDILLLRLLAHPAVLEESRSSMLRLLDPLLIMGEQGTTLIETLKIWLREDESIPRTADILGLHVNTVRQRLERCRSVLGLGEFKTDTRLRLYAALQLLQMLRSEES